MTSSFARRIKAAALVLPLVLGGVSVVAVFALHAPALHAQESVSASVDVDALIARLPPDLSITYANKSVDVATGWSVLEGVTLISKSEPARRITATRIVLGGVDLDAFETIFRPERYGATPDETFRMLLWGFTIEGLSVMDGAKEVVRIGTLTFGGLEMKQFAFKPMGDDQAAYEAQFLSPSDADLQMAGAVLDSIRTGTIEVRDLVFTAEGSEVKVGELGFEGYDRGRLGAVVQRNVTSSMANPMSGEAITTSVASSESRGADFSASLPWMMKAQMPPMTPDPMLWIGGGVTRDLSYNLGSEGAVTFSEISMDDVNFAWFIPTSLRFSMNGVYTPGASAMTELQPLLQRTGMTNMPFSFSLGWSYDPNAGRAAIEELAVRVDGLAGASLALRVSGLPMSFLATNDITEAWMSAAMFDGASVSLSDAGNLATLLDFMAEQQGMTGEQFREQGKAGLVASLMAAGLQGDPRADAIIQAFSDFLANPGTLTIAAMPPAPVMIMMMMMSMNDPRTALDQLGLTITHTPD